MKQKKKKKIWPSSLFFLLNIPFNIDLNLPYPNLQKNRPLSLMESSKKKKEELTIFPVFFAA